MDFDAALDAMRVVLGEPFHVERTEDADGRFALAMWSRAGKGADFICLDDDNGVLFVYASGGELTPGPGWYLTAGSADDGLVRVVTAVEAARAAAQHRGWEVPA